ncbi:MAG: hypothetical protein KC461_13400 [Dehalococcoidia bacterium]|nr:hypothetical protein [Dehalococcoidia bacterium]
MTALAVVGTVERVEPAVANVVGRGVEPVAADAAGRMVEPAVLVERAALVAT